MDIHVTFWFIFFYDEITKSLIWIPILAKTTSLDDDDDDDDDDDHDLFLHHKKSVFKQF